MSNKLFINFSINQIWKTQVTVNSKPPILSTITEDN